MLPWYKCFLLTYIKDMGEDFMLDVSRRLKEYSVQQNLPVKSTGRPPRPNIHSETHIESPAARDEDNSKELPNLAIKNPLFGLQNTLSDPLRDDSSEIPLQNTELFIGSPIKPHLFTKCIPEITGRKGEGKDGDFDIVGSDSMPQSAASSISVPSPVAVGNFF